MQASSVTVDADTIVLIFEDGQTRGRERYRYVPRHSVARPPKKVESESTDVRRCQRLPGRDSSVAMPHTRAASVLALLFASQVTVASAREATDRTVALPPSIADLPLVELRADGDSHQIAVFYSGDGGWATLDKSVSARLAASGVRVIGVNTLRYFWKERQPEEAAQDLARVLRTYLLDKPAARDVLLIGYSTGADVLPFIVNRLPNDLRARVASVTLIAPSREAQFRIHVADWITHQRRSGVPVMPEVERLGVPLLCLYGQGDLDVLCPELSERATIAVIGKGHHLGRDYTQIAGRILSFTAPTATQAPRRQP
jgi:type IV secretory pathway VirJ component